MAGDPQVLRLLEEMLSSGKTPEEVCRHCPELLPEVRRRWQQFQLVDAQVSSLLPGPGTSSDAGATTPPESVPVPPAAFGRYEVRGTLGAGGFGAVYLGHDTQLDRPVAIKVLHAEARPAQAGESALQEARRLAQLRHPGIVAVHDVGMHEGQVYIVSDYLDGPDLGRWLRGDRPPELGRACLKALAKRQEDRYTTAGDFAADLRRVLPTWAVAELTGPQSGWSASPPISAVKRHSVGRQKELVELGRAFESVAAGQGLFLCVTGEPGIGKTTLVEDFVSELATTGLPFAWARGRCSERLAGTEAYLPFLEALESLLKGAGGEAAARVMKT